METRYIPRESIKEQQNALDSSDQTIKLRYQLNRKSERKIHTVNKLFKLSSFEFTGWRIPRVIDSARGAAIRISLSNESVEWTPKNERGTARVVLEKSMYPRLQRRIILLVAETGTRGIFARTKEASIDYASSYFRSNSFRRRLTMVRGN